ncbi:MAG: cytochrome C oxidase subunit I [Ferruginibacter sp.]
MIISNDNTKTSTTHYTAIIPFYSYAAICFLISAIILFISSSYFTGHYFQPKILALTHLMALGWGTMMILGASHQLIPVLIQESLYSTKLAYLCFVFAALGIPLLVYGFYTFNLGTNAKAGGILINLAVVVYIINIAKSFSSDKKENIHALFIFTASIWLLLTTSIGLLLLYNFTENILPQSSLYYLSIHAHFGIGGWFLLLIIGVGSRLIPMFMISKFQNIKLLRTIYYLINIGLVTFVISFTFPKIIPAFIPAILITFAIGTFIFYCRSAYLQRIRRKVDMPVKISLLSLAMVVLPIVILIVIVMFSINSNNQNIILAYGFCVFFGWITSLILGMTFKTLPFIIWNKAYKNNKVKGKNLDPKTLFNQNIFNVMAIIYITGFLIFLFGIIFYKLVLLQAGSLLLILTALLYNWNVIKLIMHKV